MNLDLVQKRIIKNKVEKGFNTTDIEQEFRSLYSELEEALDAYRNESVERVAEELADVTIYTLGIAELLGIDMEEAINNKMTVNENRVYVKREDGTPVKLGAVHLPSGQELGTPFAKITFNQEGRLDLENLRKTVEKYNRMYFEFPYTQEELGELYLVRLDENDVEEQTLFEFDLQDEDEEDFEAGIKGEKLLEFFKIDSTKAAMEDVEFILLYDKHINEFNRVEYISYYLTYLKPYDRFV